MSVADEKNLLDYCRDVARQARVASHGLSSIGGAIKNRWLSESAARLREQSAAILTANKKDIDAAPGFGLTEAQTDRLRLTRERIDDIAMGMQQIALLPDPIGEMMDATVRPNQLEVRKVRVPLGVIFFIYESRPNVTADAAAICVKSGNAVILRGGKEAAHSSRAIVDILREVAADVGLPPGAVQLVQTADRDAVGHFLSLDDYIDLAIPRGGEGLIRRVAGEARMPVIKHFSGNCHVYIDRSANLDMAEKIAINSKCQRMGVCNAAESLIVHADIAAELLPRLSGKFAEKGVEVRGDARSCQLVENAKSATEDDHRAEFLGPVISVAVVDSIDEAIERINRYGSGHTDSIVTTDLNAARQFAATVDSSAVMINASTRFNDGAEFGLGAEIGISTDKFHARGPCGLKELTSYKYVVYGDGQLK